MSSSVPAVEPAHLWVPDYARTYGGDVAELNEHVGFPPDPEQRIGLDATFAVDRNDKSAAFEVAVICSRQNLKTGLFKQATLGWLFVTHERLVVWSAHEFRTAQEAFRDIEELISGSDVLRREVKHVYRGNGDEAIELLSGARLIFKTRTRGGGRGLSGRKVVLDEGFALQPMHMGALLPTLSAQPDPQVLYGSSAGLADSTVLQAVRDRGRAGGDPRLAWIEWCAPPPAEACDLGDQCPHTLTTPGCGCDKPEYWQMANPQMGRRITVDYIAAERRALPPEEFGRERMGWWDEPVGGQTPFSLEQWGDLVESDEEPRPPRPAMSMDVTPDLGMAAVGSGGRSADGVLHVDVLEHRPGTDWLVDTVDERFDDAGACVLVLYPGGQAGAFLPELNERGFKTDPDPSRGERQLHLLSKREYAQACGAFVDDVTNGDLRHRDRRELNDAVEGVRAKPLEDAFTWSRADSSVDISPLVVVTEAKQGYDTYGVLPEPAPTTPFALWGD